MLGAEQRDLGYLFKLKQSANVKKLIGKIFPKENGGGGTIMAGARGHVAAQWME